MKRSAPFSVIRRRTNEVRIGSTPMGADYPIRIQSMANTSTLDTDGSVAQAIRIIDAGGEYVRFTAQGVREATNLGQIKRKLCEKGYSQPLVADIHFNPKAADAAAEQVDKVRINPGNYIDSVKTFVAYDYTVDEYTAELQRLRSRFLPFVESCRSRGVAIRIGVNHGSLSDRIMSRYGDTPEGMVESCMEFLRLCVEVGFADVVISMKASNTVVMTRSVRLLVEQMDAERMLFPLHLGVTEAGEGEDGRIKSAVGIGALLYDGIGDTIRVSLSEAPEVELPVARCLVDHIQNVATDLVDGFFAPDYVWAKSERRTTHAVGRCGAGQLPVVLVSGAIELTHPSDYRFEADRLINTLGETIALCRVDCDSPPSDLFQKLATTPDQLLLLTSDRPNAVGSIKSFIHKMMSEGLTHPVIPCLRYDVADIDTLRIHAGADCGALFLAGLCDGVCIESPAFNTDELLNLSLSILQACRLRTSKTEYISCPSCGRTLFDLPQAIARIKAATSHLVHLKIGVMGCIVNGPGEMADADYGYVGSGRGKIDLYRGKVCVERAIDETKAVEHLLRLIDEDQFKQS